MLAALCDFISIAHPQPGVKCFFSEQHDFLWRHLSDGAAQLLERPLFDTGDIAARQVHTAGDLVLRQWSGSAETVPQTDDFALARTERGEERTVHRIIAVMIVHSVQTLVLAADRILKRKRIAVAVGLERIRERETSPAVLRLRRKCISSSFWIHLEA